MSRREQDDEKRKVVVAAAAAFVFGLVGLSLSVSAATNLGGKREFPCIYKRQISAMESVWHHAKCRNE